ncbi:hypothetical protein Tco_1149125 [Tanacetum coccineum]
MAEQDTPPPTITAMKIPIIKKGEYDIWSMRMRQYICHTDHNLWDVIINGDLEEEAAPSGEQSAPPAPKTAKQLAAKRSQERFKSILLLAIPDEYLLKFHNVPDAKSLWAVFKSRFGGAIYRIEDFKHALRASVDFTTFQNLRAQVLELRSENDDLKLLVEELTKERELIEATLRQRDEIVLTQYEKMRLLEKQPETFHDVHSEID